VGDVPLAQCNLAGARRADPNLDAFLFWSRAPYVERLENGTWSLSDARFASRGGRFSVTLPEAACRPDET
jgi:inner membrane protein